MEGAILKKILIICGTRPEIIKLFPIITCLKVRGITPIVVFTGQHMSLAIQMLETFDIKPDHVLSVLVGEQSLNQLHARLMKKLDLVFIAEKPDLVIVQGDTASAVTGALSAFYHRVPVAHVEAGLRSDNLAQPFPEELNRRVISQIATYNFCPTKANQMNLGQENVLGEKIVTGNTGIDTLLVMKNRMSKIRQKKQIYVTLHRRENFGKPMENIFDAMDIFLQLCPDFRFLFAVHPNPQVKEVVRARWKGRNTKVWLTHPLNYLDNIRAIKQSYFILTDSGGIQEEAPYLQRPVLVARETTERPEVLWSGLGKLVGTSTEGVLQGLYDLAEDVGMYRKMVSRSPKLFGKGHAAEKICDYLLKL